MSDRRRTSRFVPSSHGGLKATLRPGCTAVVIDVSAGGTLVETSKPLRPGAAVHLQLKGRGRAVVVHAHVLRCMVWSIDPLDGIRYRGALSFDRQVDWSAREIWR